MTRFAPVNTPARILLGPGPSDIAPSVMRAMMAPVVGYLDPAFLAVMDELQVMLRRVFETDNATTLAISGTGTAGMEACLVNLVEPGDRVLVVKSGYFGDRIADIAQRCGGEVTLAESEWGRAVPMERIRDAGAGRRFKLLAAVHTETSTGVQQPLDGLREVADELGALVLVDAVASLGGVGARTDSRGLDVVYTGSQKCLSAPPGTAPVTFSARARAAAFARPAGTGSFYFDLRLLERFWTPERVYHHTPPMSALYGLHEACRVILEEGLEARFARHLRMHRALVAGLSAMGLELPVPEEERSPTLNLVRIPDGVSDVAVRAALLAKHGLEIGGGLGPMKGRAWRIGLLGESASRRNVVLALSALHEELVAQGHRPKDHPMDAASPILDAE